MSELLKSKVGWGLAVIHLSTVLSCLLFLSLIDHTNVIVVFILLIITAPWGFLFMLLHGMFGISVPEIESNKTRDLIFMVQYGLGGLINSLILYLLGFLLIKAFNYIAPTNPKP